VNDPELLRRLARMESILRLAFADALEREAQRIADDRVDAATMAACAPENGWRPTTDLQREVAAATGKTTRTVRTRLGELVARGVLEVVIEAGKPRYRSSGLI
jgi:hypothetical protein